jgi:outer membrane protein assembly factor BamB
MTSRRKFIQSSLGAAALAALSHATGAAEQPNWSMFRGPEGRGIADGATFPDKWSTTENVAWKTDLPGRGWSSPVAWGDRVFVTTVVDLGQMEAPKKGLYFGGERHDIPKTEHEWKVLCLDLASGKVLWDKTVHKGRPQSSIHLKNSFASETPVTDGKRVYAYFGNVGVFCLDMDGNSVWSFPIEPRPSRYGWGTAASPALHGDRLYIVNDNEQQSYLLAIDTNTGIQSLRVNREDERSNWSTPYIWQHDRTEIITLGSIKIRSYDLEGKVLWSMKGTTGIAIAMPYSANGLLYVSSGYVGAPLKPIYAIQPGAAGDITVPQGNASGPSVAWCDWKAGPYNPSTLVYGKRLYVLLDRGMLACHDPLTGKVIFEKQRIPGGGGFTASPWAANGRIFCINEDGVTSVFQDGDTFQPLHRNTLADDDMGMASPAIASDRLLIRTMARLYCIK